MKGAPETIPWIVSGLNGQRPGRFGLPLRQTTGLVASLLRLAGLDWPVPDFSTLSRRQKGLKVAIPCRPSTGVLHLLIDSTGIKSEGEGERFAKKHGPSKPRQRRKLHLGTEEDQDLIWGSNPRRRRTRWKSWRSR